MIDNNIIKFPSGGVRPEKLTTEQKLERMENSFNGFIQNAWNPLVGQVLNTINNLEKKLTTFDGTITALLGGLNARGLLSKEAFDEAYQSLIIKPQAIKINNAKALLQASIDASKQFSNVLQAHTLDKTHLQEHTEVPEHLV